MKSKKAKAKAPAAKTKKVAKKAVAAKKTVKPKGKKS